MIKPKIKITKETLDGFEANVIAENKVVEIEDTSAKIKALQDENFNIKFNYDRLLNFTRDLLTHEQHTLFAAKKKEIFE